MAKGYWVASVDVTAPEGYKLYIAENRSVFREYGARFLTRGGRSKILKLLQRIIGQGWTSIKIVNVRTYGWANLAMCAAIRPLPLVDK